MQKLSGIAAENGYPLMFLYHNIPTVENGKAFRRDDSRMLEIFKTCCERNGILFVDVTERFLAHFQDTYELPYGFSNTSMGSGHLNVLGHQLISEELFACVAQLTEGN